MKIASNLRHSVYFYLVLIIGLSSTSVLEGAPANDDFENRITITGLTNSVTGSNVDATKETREPDHAGYASVASVWWTWTAPTNGVFGLDTSDSTFQTTLAVYTGIVVSNLLEIASGNDSGFGFGSGRLIFVAVAGTSYQIAVDSKYGGSGAIELNLAYVGVPLPNDSFANATPILGNSNYLAGSTVNATYELEEPDPYNLRIPSVWWVFDAMTHGTIRLQKEDRYVPVFEVYVGDSLINLAFITSGGGSTTWACSFSFNVIAASRYYIRAAYPPSNFNFNFVVEPAASNDDFDFHAVLNPAVQRATGTTVGATRETDEPQHGTNSVWWSWTPTNSGPVILTTTGSKFETTLVVYTGTALTNLSLVASNRTAYAWDGTNGPASDPASRLRLEAIAGTTYQIAVAGGAGEVVLNFERLAIETIATLTRAVQPDRSVDFTADLLLSNFRPTESQPLRIRLLARPWYITRDGVFFPCPENWPAFDAPDVALGVFSLTAPSSLSSSNSRLLNINGTVPPPFETSQWGYGYGVVAVLEENLGGVWIPHDTRMVLPGDWAMVSGFGGPGGGVLLIVPSQSSATGSGYLQVHISPAAARQAGAGWRLRGETLYRTDPQAAVLISTNDPVVVEFAAVPGWLPPQNQTNLVSLELLTVVDVNYTVTPPSLSASPAQGIGLTGTTNTTYRIECRTNLTSGVWLPLRTNTITSAGFNLLLPWPPTNGLPAAFYRAVWLP